MGFIRKIFDFVAHPTHSRTLGLLGIITFIGIVSLTVIVAQQQQNLQQKASNTCEDLSSLPNCSDIGASPGADCSQNKAGCKIGNTIYECK